MTDLSKYGDEAPLISPDEFASWIIEDTPDLLVLNKPGWVVCHPSKNGPWSSLVGAAREHTGLDKLHLVARLDRETSGIVVLAKRKPVASVIQQAIEGRLADKSYLAILQGEVPERREVSRPMEDDRDSPVAVKMRIVKGWGGVKAQTTFIPIAQGGGYTLCEVRPFTGRKHQIRVHAQWMGNPVAADKLYGPDETLYLEFVEKGFTERLQQVLPLPRQALHAWKLGIETRGHRYSFQAPLQPDMAAFIKDVMGVEKRF